ncbi:putative Polycomb group protein ASXL2 [Prionailurus viverrinus]|uniref:putative Polycomb group protein ASXL2 n=1 Tax=Prionailurus viverrinus TaxID=61388 RepID=UPI001FF6990F|nr:putative Polycomb group protein ASXL2 [Prionailurus viverrinus]
MREDLCGPPAQRTHKRSRRLHVVSRTVPGTQRADGSQQPLPPRESSSCSEPPVCPPLERLGCQAGVPTRQTKRLPFLRTNERTDALQAGSCEPQAPHPLPERTFSCQLLPGSCLTQQLREALLAVPPRVSPPSRHRTSGPAAELPDPKGAVAGGEGSPHCQVGSWPSGSRKNFSSGAGSVSHRQRAPTLQECRGNHPGAGQTSPSIRPSSTNTSCGRSTPHPPPHCLPVLTLQPIQASRMVVGLPGSEPSRVLAGHTHSSQAALQGRTPGTPEKPCIAASLRRCRRPSRAASTAAGCNGAVGGDPAVGAVPYPLLGLQRPGQRPAWQEC